LTGSMSFQIKISLYISLHILFILTVLEMNAIFVYRQTIYTEIDISHTIFGSLPQALPNMFLTMIGMAKVTQGITISSALKDNFPAWKYFVGEFQQYIAGSNRVCSPTVINLLGILDETCT